MECLGVFAEEMALKGGLLWGRQRTEARHPGRSDSTKIGRMSRKAQAFYLADDSVAIK